MMARVLAVDVGLRRIGLALSDASKLIARPLTVLTVTRGAGPADAAADIATLAREHGADELVVGLPLHENGSRAELTGAAEALAAALRSLTGLPVHLVDERHSTAEARAILQGKPAKRRTRHDDAHAAAIILQRWLDGRRETTEVWDSGRSEEGEDA